ncbi:MAG: antifreeze protein [Tabrizicola sp.]|nr:antifreeze protein [Tabrizicola sp.]
MLLSVFNAKHSLVAAVAAFSIAAIPAAPAHAWGDKEQGFLAGVVTSVIVGEVIKQKRKTYVPPPAPVYVAPAPPPVYVQPRPVHSSIYGTPAAQAFNSYSASERRAIQRNLRAWGYYRGGIDGSFGPGTYNAIVAYARDEGASRSLQSANGAYALYDGLIF